MGLAVLLAGVSAVAVVPARAEEPFCFECHDDFPTKMKAFKFTHDPAAGGECTACHVDHKDEEKLMLVKEGAALCYECHDNMAQGTSVHPPVAEGKCTGCHNPHGSANKKLLVAAGQALCEKCHAASPEFKGRVTHAAIDDGCSDCHRPHASENPRLLTKNLDTGPPGALRPQAGRTLPRLPRPGDVHQDADRGHRLPHGDHEPARPAPQRRRHAEQVRDHQEEGRPDLLRLPPPAHRHPGEAAAHRVPVHGHVLLHDALRPERQRRDLHRRLPQAEDLFAGGPGPERDGRHCRRGPEAVQ